MIVIIVTVGQQVWLHTQKAEPKLILNTFCTVHVFKETENEAPFVPISFYEIFI